MPKHSAGSRMMLRLLIETDTEGLSRLRLLLKDTMLQTHLAAQEPKGRRKFSTPRSPYNFLIVLKSRKHVRSAKLRPRKPEKTLLRKRRRLLRLQLKSYSQRAIPEPVVLTT